jgi:hypothetical protein
VIFKTKAQRSCWYKPKDEVDLRIFAEPQWSKVGKEVSFCAHKKKFVFDALVD